MAKKVTNQIMLITYADCMGNNLQDLQYVLKEYLEGAVYGIHILPFFPSTADRGFAPVNYREVSQEFGTWDDIMNLGETYYLMYDYMINHISAHSDIYQDFLQKKEDSRYRNFFIRYKDFWEGGEPTQEQYDKIYVRRENGPYIYAHFADGTSEKLWCTFSDEQIDINCSDPEAKKYLRENLDFLTKHGASLIRLDAFAYTTKKAGTNCFFVEPDVWPILAECRDILEEQGAQMLPEIHENYFIQKKMGEKGYYVYDFQLPMLLLNAIFFGKTLYLKTWLQICPRKQFTTLDTHDGIGVVDARYLLPDEELLETKQRVFQINPEISQYYTKVNFDKFDTYQINCTYYSALGEDDDKYFMARAVQFFAPGIPQVYYVGMLAGKNDYEFLRKTKQGRDVNRHYYTLEEVAEELKRPVVDRLIRLMRLRNHHPAFNGTFRLLESGETALAIRWENGADFACLYVDFQENICEIQYTENHKVINF